MSKKEFEDIISSLADKLGDQFTEQLKSGKVHIHFSDGRTFGAPTNKEELIEEILDYEDANYDEESLRKLDVADLQDIYNREELIEDLIDLSEDNYDYYDLCDLTDAELNELYEKLSVIEEIIDSSGDLYEVDDLIDYDFDELKEMLDDLGCE